MTVTDTLTRWTDRGRTLAEGMAFAPALLTRLVIGAAFVQTGLGKWQHLARTADFFASAGIPFPAANAVLVATFELVGGPLLVLGLGTRPTSAVLASTMVVALLTADRAAFLGALKPGGESGLTDVTAFVFLLFLLWLATFGPGPVSLDRWLRARRSRKDAAPAP